MRVMENSESDWSVWSITTRNHQETREPRTMRAWRALAPAALRGGKDLPKPHALPALSQLQEMVPNFLMMLARKSLQCTHFCLRTSLWKVQWASCQLPIASSECCCWAERRTWLAFLFSAVRSLVHHLLAYGEGLARGVCWSVACCMACVRSVTALSMDSWEEVIG
jgi:hypothetical protein